MCSARHRFIGFEAGCRGFDDQLEIVNVVSTGFDDRTTHHEHFIFGQPFLQQEPGNRKTVFVHQPFVAEVAEQHTPCRVEGYPAQDVVVMAQISVCLQNHLFTRGVNRGWHHRLKADRAVSLGAAQLDERFAVDIVEGDGGERGG
ncbi:MAG: hypothetical protein JW395_1075 [Nitrospira sp.]|nr:hypothetical protein [Nitrospira sp.]